ncbi:movement protein [Subterranean clover stunt virus]|uniref:Movement protein n=1 Tax=Subterranean clover stunt virus TaxID=36772 RepID=A0A411K8D1_SCSV|nr:movement protein [Subterranean clover stunt virus]QBC74513.1 movement protein [Subterranean clover stunt virus]
MDSGDGYNTYSYEEGAGDAKKEVLYKIGIIMLCIVGIVVLWVLIILCCAVPRYAKSTMDAWLSSSSIMKRKMASRITGTPFEETGPQRERRWAERRTEATNQNNNDNVNRFS